MQKFAANTGANWNFTARALDALEKYSWPGNVREMENLIERLAIIVDGGVIDVKHLSLYISHTQKEWGTEESQELDSLKDMERRGVLAALERNNWVQSRAAKDLGITLRQMVTG